jgi:hypothetical protein
MIDYLCSPERRSQHNQLIVDKHSHTVLDAEEGLNDYGCPLNGTFMAFSEL